MPAKPIDMLPGLVRRRGRAEAGRQPGHDRGAGGPARRARSRSRPGRPRGGEGTGHGAR